MTQVFDRTVQSPQTDVNLDEYNTEERRHIRKISVQGSQSFGENGPLKSVVYLRGDEREAARKFVEANMEQLKEFDLSGRNRLQEYLNREIYDWVLHFLGARALEKFETVVRESRPDGTTWIIEREQYERHNRRYTVSEGKVAKLSEVTPRKVFDSFGSVVTESDIETHDQVKTKDPMALLEYYRVSPDYNVEATTITRKAESGHSEESALRVLEDTTDSDDDITGVSGSESNIETEISTKRSNSERTEQGNTQREPDHRYFAVMIDTIGTIRVRIKQSKDHNIGYALRPQFRFSRKQVDRSIVERFTDYCGENGISYRIEERQDRDSIICVISGIKNTRKLLTKFRPDMIQQSEQVEIMLDEILPAMESREHNTKEGFLKVMESVDRLRETLRSTSNTRYNKAYFESEWNLDSPEDT
ncbi:hypothetical protein [Haloplanus sp. C73]|uniref:hypothetical protein n=1 Tax=Haloplanus sp. C73 TaxID=3421641 RepID=UPI003EB92F34